MAEKVDIAMIMLTAIRDTRARLEQKRAADYISAAAAAEKRRSENEARDAESLRLAGLSAEEEEAEINILNDRISGICGRASAEKWEKIRSEVSPDEYARLRHEARARQREIEERWDIRR